jgi:hypothetical protein
MRRFNNKLLVGTFLGLLGSFLLIKTFFSPKPESNIAKDFAVLDTAKISLIKIYFKGQDKKVVHLTRNEDGWMATTTDRQGWVSDDVIRELLNSLHKVRIDRLVASDDDSWNELYVSDTLGVRMTVATEDELVANWHIGTPPSDGTAYIRVNDDEKVYLLEDIQLASLVNRPSDYWRDKKLIPLKKGQINRIVFNFPADSSFTLLKNDSTWTMGNININSVSVSSYLTNISSQSIFSLAGDSLCINSPDITVEFWDNNNSASFIKAWKHEDNWVISSSYQFANCFFVTDATIKTSMLFNRKIFSD